MSVGLRVTLDDAPFIERGWLETIAAASSDISRRRSWMSPDRAFVLPPGGGRSINLGNFGMTVKAAADDTGGGFSLLEAAEPPGFGPPLHIHADCGEAFYVLEGIYQIFIDDVVFDCPAGSFAFIPSGRRHGFRVGELASRKLNLYVPAAMIGYFDELSALVSAGEPDPDAVDAIGRRHGMEVLGPVPEGYV
jgi:mannose-6-phosphate isomerase-like protein (cupin superfamily)